MPQQNFISRRAAAGKRACWRSHWNLNKLNQVNLEYFEDTHKNCPSEQCIISGETAEKYGVIEKINPSSSKNSQDPPISKNTSNPNNESILSDVTLTNENIQLNQGTQNIISEFTNTPTTQPGFTQTSSLIPNSEQDTIASNIQGPSNSIPINQHDISDPNTQGPSDSTRNNQQDINDSNIQGPSNSHKFFKDSSENSGTSDNDPNKENQEEKNKDNIDHISTSNTSNSDHASEDNLAGNNQRPIGELSRSKSLNNLNNLNLLGNAGNKNIHQPNPSPDPQRPAAEFQRRQSLLQQQPNMHNINNFRSNTNQFQQHNNLNQNQPPIQQTIHSNQNQPQNQNYNQPLGNQSNVPPANNNNFLNHSNFRPMNNSNRNQSSRPNANSTTIPLGRSVQNASASRTAEFVASVQNQTNTTVSQSTLEQVLSNQNQQNINTQDFMQTIATAMDRLTNFVTADRHRSASGGDDDDNFGDHNNSGRAKAINSTFFQAKHIKHDDDDDIFNYVKKMAKIYQAADRDLSLTKKMKAVQTADIDIWDKSKYKSCLAYLWKEFHSQISKIGTLTPYEVCCFIYMGFDPKSKAKVMKAISEIGRSFVQNENFIEELVERNLSFIHDNGHDIRDDRLDMDKLRLIVYPYIAQVVQPGVMTIDQDKWESDAGEDLVDYFKETLDLIQIDNDTVLKAPNVKELASGLKKLSSLLEKNGQKEVIDAINLNQTLQRVSKRMLTNITLDKVLHELEGCYLVAEPALLRKSKTDSVNVTTAVEAETNWIGNNNRNNYASSDYRHNNPQSNYNTSKTSTNSYSANNRNFNNYRRNRPPNYRFSESNYNGNRNNPNNRYRTQFESIRPIIHSQHVNYLRETGSIVDEPDDEAFVCVVSELDVDYEDPVEEVDEGEVNMASFDPSVSGFMHIRMVFSSSIKSNQYVRALIDTASSISLIKPAVLREHGLDKFKYTANKPTRAKGFNSTENLLPERVKLFCRLGMLSKTLDFVVGPEKMAQDVLVGKPVCDMLGISKAIVEQLYKLRIPVDCPLRDGKSAVEVAHVSCQTIDLSSADTFTLSPPTATILQQPNKPKEVNNEATTILEDLNKGVDGDSINVVAADGENKIEKKVHFVDNKNSSDINKINSENISEIEKSGGGSNENFSLKNIKTPENLPTPIHSHHPSPSPESPPHVSSSAEMSSVVGEPDKKPKKRKPQSKVEYDALKPLLGNLSVDQKRLLCSLIELDNKGRWDASVSMTEAGKILQNHSDPISFEAESDDLKCYITVKDEVVIPAGNHCEVKVSFPIGCRERSWSCHPFKRSNLHVMDRVVFASSTADTALHVSNHHTHDIKLHIGQRLAIGKLLNNVDLPSHGLEHDIQKRKTLYSYRELAEIFTVYESVTNKEMVETNRQKAYVNYISDGVIGVKEATIADKNELDKIHKDYVESREKEFSKLVDKLDPEIKEVFIEFKDRFMGDPADEWKLLHVQPISLPLQPNHPRQVRVNYRKRFTEKEIAVIDDFLVTSLARRLITRSNSNILSPLLIVPKPQNRGYRVCCDFRQVNQRVFDYNSHIIPEISDIILRLGSATLFTMFDVSSAYWRCPLADDGSREATAFVVHQGEFAGVYHWNVLPFGPKAAVSLFSRIMDDCLRGLKGLNILWYLDDCIVASGDKSMTRKQVITQHAADIRRLLLRARAKNLTFSLEKTVAAQEFVEVLGFFMGGGQVRAGKQTTNKINSMIEAVDMDANQTQFSAVLGFFNYSRKFIPKFSKGHREIRKLKEEYDNTVKAKSKTAVELKSLKDESREKIIKILTGWATHIKSDSLAVPSKDDELEISSDASQERLGYLIRIAKTGAIVEFNSREFNACEANYNIMEKELLAMAEALEKLRIYVHRAPKVTCLCDNSCAISAINSSKTSLSPRALKFVMRIQNSPNCTFSLIGTKVNSASDALSRGLVFNTEASPVESPDTTADSDPEEVEVVLRSGNKSAQTSDKQNKNSTAQTMGEYLDEEMKKRLLTLHTNQGHLKAKRMNDIIKFHFPFLKASAEDLKSIVENCAHCMKLRRCGSASCIGRLPIPKTPNDTLHIDHFSPSGRDALCRKKAVLSLRDSFSKFVSLFACTGYGHSEILGHIRTWCTIFGAPKTLMMDNALESTAMKNFCEYYGINLIFVPAYRPEANGIVERVHRDIRQLLPRAIDQLGLRDTNWTNALPRVCAWVNSNTHSVTGRSPNEIHLGYNDLDFDLNSADRWTEIFNKLQTAQDKMQRENAGPFRDTKLLPGQEIWAFLGKKDPIPAVIVEDFGKTVYIDKLDSSLTRFQKIPLHKSDISIRL